MFGQSGLNSWSLSEIIRRRISEAQYFFSLSKIAKYLSIVPQISIVKAKGIGMDLVEMKAFFHLIHRLFPSSVGPIAKYFVHSASVIHLFTLQRALHKSIHLN